MKAKRLLARCFPGTFKPKWNQCRLSSNWDGKNAARRMMNLLSPHFSDGKVKDYLKWQKGRGLITPGLGTGQDRRYTSMAHILDLGRRSERPSGRCPARS